MQVSKSESQSKFFLSYQNFFAQLYADVSLTLVVTFVSKANVSRATMKRDATEVLLKTSVYFV